MMRSLFPAWVLCLSLLPLETQTLPLSAQTQRHRIPGLPESSSSVAMPTASNPSAAPDNNIAFRDRHAAWMVLLHKGPPPRLSSPLPDHRVSRGRRHASGGRSHSQLMRVGCVLGTCQVQNLSHRLYQLIGQSGRADSSPINPRSPHSYG